MASGCPPPGFGRDGSRTGRPRETSTMVDSMPISHGPPFQDQVDIGPQNLRARAPRGRTDPAEAVGRRRGDATADSRSSSSATGCPGTRRPIVSCPPVSSSPTPAARRNTRVSGPGQKRAAAWQRAPGPRVPTIQLPISRCGRSRMVLGTPLYRIDPRHGRGTGRIRPQAIHGLGGKRDEAPAPQHRRGPL